MFSPATATITAIAAEGCKSASKIAKGCKTESKKPEPNPHLQLPESRRTKYTSQTPRRLFQIANPHKIWSRVRTSRKRHLQKEVPGHLSAPLPTTHTYIHRLYIHTDTHIQAGNVQKRATPKTHTYMYAHFRVACAQNTEHTRSLSFTHIRFNIACHTHAYTSPRT